MFVDMVLPPIASIIVARAMGPAKLGAFSYVTWLSTTATLLGAAGVSAAGRKYMADSAGQNRPDVFRALLRSGLLVQTAILALLALVGLVWAHVALPADERVFASLAMIAILPGGVMFMATAVNNAVQELRPNVVASIASGIVHAVGMILTVTMGWGLVGLAAASLASRTCDCVVRWSLTAARLPAYLQAMGNDPTPSGQRPALPPGLSRQFAIFVGESTILTTLSLVVWNRSEMLFLKRYSAIEEVAYFSVAFGLSLLPGQIVGPFSRAAVVGVYAEHGRAEQAGVHVTRIYWRYLVLLVMPASLGLAVLSGPLLSVLYGARYLDAAPVLLLAGALSMFGPLASPATSLVTAAGGQRRLVMVGLLAAMATLALDYVLVRAYAAAGGALANGLGQAISTVTIILVARRYSFRVASSFFLRVTGAALGMAILVGAAVHLLPPLGGVIVGPVLGAVAYCALLRALRLIDADDVERLLKAESLLPRPLRASYRRLLGAIATSNEA
jgi:O-antigen/teichoic acid export membrane protein